MLAVSVLLYSFCTFGVNSMETDSLIITREFGTTPIESTFKSEIINMIKTYAGYGTLPSAENSIRPKIYEKIWEFEVENPINRRCKKSFEAFTKWCEEEIGRRHREALKDIDQ